MGDGAVMTRNRSGQKRRTRGAILTAAVAMLERGETPTAQTVAEAAEVSRRTVYQYFPTQELLLTEAALEAVRGAVEDPLALVDDDIDARLDTLVDATLDSCLDREPLLRTMVRVTIDQRLAEAAGSTPREAPLRGVRRLAWIETALEPIRGQLSEARYERLVSALAVCIGFEALLVLRDVRGLDPEGAKAVSRWMARTLVHSSLTADD